MRGIFTTPGVLSYTSTNCVAPLNIVSTGIREVVSLEGGGGGGGGGGGLRGRGGKGEKGVESYRIHYRTNPHTEVIAY